VDPPNIAQVAFPTLACLRPQIGHALNPAAPAAITRLQTWIAAWANQVVDMGLLTQTAEPPDGRQLGSRQIRHAVLALVNTGRFSPGRVSMEADRAPRCWFSQVPHFRLGGPKSSGLMAEPVPDARSLKDRRIFLLKVFGDHEPNPPPIERRSESHAQDLAR
jgi:hypothetical protein